MTVPSSEAVSSTALSIASPATATDRQPPFALLLGLAWRLSAARSIAP